MKNPKLQSAIILSAGFGTRLRPLTNTIPKPVVPVAGIPGILYPLHHLLKGGIERFYVNGHHLSGPLEQLLSLNLLSRDYTYIEEPKIYGTGGGIANFKGLIKDDNFLVHNCDVISDIDFSTAYATHQDNNNTVTMILTDFPPKNMVKIDDNSGLIESFRGGSHCFSGISILNRRIFDYLEKGKFINIIEIYNELISTGKERIGYHIADSGHIWHDYGTFDELDKVSDIVKSHRAFEDLVKANPSDYDIYKTPSEELLERLLRRYSL